MESERERGVGRSMGWRAEPLGAPAMELGRGAATREPTSRPVRAVQSCSSHVWERVRLCSDQQPMRRFQLLDRRFLLQDEMEPARRLAIFAFLAIFLIFTPTEANHSHITLDLKIRDVLDLSEFYSMLEHNPFAMNTLKYSDITVFAPLNSAFQDVSKRTEDQDLVLYHMANSPLTLSNLGPSVNTMGQGNPPIWVTKVNPDLIYLNNARVITEKSNTYLNYPKKQVLHVIEKLLEPVRFISPETTKYNPTAYDFLEGSEDVRLGNIRLRSFRQRVKHTGKEDLYKRAGKHTFFIPIDEGFQGFRHYRHGYSPKRHHSRFSFQPPPRPEKIDEITIDGHVIEDQVLFTDPTPDNKQYKTVAWGRIKVNVSFSTETDNLRTQKYVKSHTIVGDSDHPDGVVLAEIVKGNIPVSNGVIHLIHRPLMVVDVTISQFLEDREDGPLYKFYEVIRDVGGDLMERMTQMRELTLFAPSNAAWKDPSLNNILRDTRKIREILHMHLVEEKLPLDRIIEGNQLELFQVNTLALRKNLYFNVVTSGSNRTLTVEGGGVNATVVQPDIAATNGIIHIIDKVLGVPFTTVGRKMATDPMLNKTFLLGKIQGFNDQLDDMSKRFTYFVPRDYAWKKMETKYPSAHKKIFMNDFAYHAKQILERHLVVADKRFTMADLRNLTTHEARQLPTVRDVVKLRVKESDKKRDNGTVQYGEWSNRTTYSRLFQCLAYLRARILSDVEYQSFHCGFSCNSLHAQQFFNQATTLSGTTNGFMCSVLTLNVQTV
ncbi:fasciclin-1 isoform X4 [Cimex lectularius]|uniref:FAS1 domain-containing protein n=1 Tax=Cimex lectularius TaxID=79782 RepID=A0A8I6RYQ8_CIMLE|nr:fasciclin-1 isoform X4 [Cimex lectularius]